MLIFVFYICLSAGYVHIPEMILPLEVFDAVMLAVILHY